MFPTFIRRTRRTRRTAPSSLRVAGTRTIEPLEPRTFLAAQLAADINPATVSAWPSDMTPFGNGQALFFATETGSPYGANLYRTDGTAAGTTLLRGGFDIDLSTYQDLTQITSAGNTALFFARPNVTDAQSLWKTDGTPAGTAELMELDEYRTTALSLSSCDGTVYLTLPGRNAGTA